MKKFRIQLHIPDSNKKNLGQKTCLNFFYTHRHNSMELRDSHNFFTKNSASKKFTWNLFVYLVLLQQKKIHQFDYTASNVHFIIPFHFLSTRK